MRKEARRKILRGREASERGREMPAGEKRKSLQRGRDGTEHAFPSPARPSGRPAMCLWRARRKEEAGRARLEKTRKKAPRRGRDRTEEKAGSARRGEDEIESPKGERRAMLPFHPRPASAKGRGCAFVSEARRSRAERADGLSCPWQQPISGTTVTPHFWRHYVGVLSVMHFGLGRGRYRIFWRLQPW